MSSRSAIDVQDEQDLRQSLHYLGTIQGCALLWDDRTHQPVWEDAEPQQITYDPDGGVTIEPLYDIYQAWWSGPGKALDCGHVVRRPDIYVTWLAEQKDECLSCVGGRS